MLLVDYRAGSKDLVRPLAKMNLPVQAANLKFGDLSFIGRGPGGTTPVIGIEYKTLRDMLNCITDHRYIAHQVPGMLATYDHSWLLIEGLWRAAGNMTLEVYEYGKWRPNRGRRMMYGDLHKYLVSTAIKGGIRIERSGNQMESLAIIYDLYRWWTGKVWEKHSTPHVFDESRALIDPVLLSPPSTFKQLVADLPGIGWERSKAVIRHFKNLREAVNAGPEEWMKVPGIGRITAGRIQSAVTGGRTRK